MSVPLVVLTGATGFVGRRLVPLLAAEGWRLRLLLRRPPERKAWRGVEPEIHGGDLADEEVLRRLVTGADAVVHVAGLIKAARRAEYDAVNTAGSARLAAAVAQAAPRSKFLHLSTLAAREPQLSGYAASKRAGEEAVLRTLETRALVLRPPAVYGPGDRETLVFFQMGEKRLVPLAGRPEARAAMIHVDDLCRLMVALLREEPAGQVLSAADARPAGYSWREVFTTAARAVGNDRARFIQAPGALLGVVALAGDVGRLLGKANMLNSEKLRELRHVDWSVPPAQLARARDWAPRYTLAEGFADAVAWYRREGWLKPEAGFDR